jgi:hypothetical protein
MAIPAGASAHRTRRAGPALSRSCFKQGEQTNGLSRGALT